MSRGSGSFVRDNIEAFAVAIAMALVIRHYCVEAFRIPTGSMMPSLYGENGKNHGDRILVDKVVGQLRDPRRWEVWVFHFPGNRAKNYIKRIVGLPNEWISIADGDLWLSRDEGESWTIERKPPGVREALLLDYYPEPTDARDAFSGKKTWKGDGEWVIDEAARRFTVDASGSASSLRFERDVVAYPQVDTGWAADPESVVGDVRVRFDLKVERAGTLAVVITEHGRAHRLVLGPDGSHFELAGQPHERFPVDLWLEEGEEYEISFSNVDNALRVTVDGESYEQVFETTRAHPPGPTDMAVEGGWNTYQIALEATGLAGTLVDLSIDRDLHYMIDQGLIPSPPEGYWVIPDGSFFAMGDNTRSSKDSREWTVLEAELKGGEVIRWDPSERSLYPGSPKNPGSESEMRRIGVISADVNGLVRRIDKSMVVAFRARTIRQPVVSRSDLIGRAFGVFWPIYIPPAYPGPTRVKLIR